MNEIVNKFLPADNKFMPEMHLKQLGFAYSACGPFTKNKERIKKSRFVKEQEAKGLLSKLGIKTPLSKIPLLIVLF